MNAISAPGALLLTPAQRGRVDTLVVRARAVGLTERGGRTLTPLEIQVGLIDAVSAGRVDTTLGRDLFVEAEAFLLPRRRQDDDGATTLAGLAADAEAYGAPSPKGALTPRAYRAALFDAATVARETPDDALLPNMLQALLLATDDVSAVRWASEARALK